MASATVDMGRTYLRKPSKTIHSRLGAAQYLHLERQFEAKALIVPK